MEVAGPIPTLTYGTPGSTHKTTVGSAPIPANALFALRLAPHSVSIRDEAFSLEVKFCESLRLAVEPRLEALISQVLSSQPLFARSLEVGVPILNQLLEPQRDPPEALRVVSLRTDHPRVNRHVLNGHDVLQEGAVVNVVLQVHLLLVHRQVQVYVVRIDLETT